MANKPGRRSIDETNKIRVANGQTAIVKAPRKNTAILSNEKKKRHQEILASMLTNKGRAVVARVLDKALTDDDPDQLACLRIVMDRILPADYLTKSKGSGNKISIQIMGVDATISGETIENEVEIDE